MRMRTWAGLATLALVGVMATSVFAQPGGGNRGRGTGGGFGFGGPGGRTQSALTLAGNAAVQKELSLTEDQIAKLKTLGDEARAELRDGAGGFEGLRDLPEEERRAKMTEMMAKQAENARKVAEKYKPKIAEILDAKQVERLDQIGLQAAGSGVYTDPNIVKALKLSKEQQDSLASITKEAGEKMRESFGAGGGNPEERAAKFRELNTQRDKDLLAVLSPEQSAQLAKMKGKEFDVAQLRGPGGGGARPGGGAPGAAPGGNGGRQRPPQ